MIVFPNAKINLGLQVIERLPDNYHRIETLFYPVEWCDILEVVENKTYTTGQPEFKLDISGLGVDGDPEKNLCYKAYHILKQKYHMPPVQAFLHKQIPMGAGLGGGSSDAAFALKLLNDLFKLNIDKSELFTMAATLGADCAFFIDNTPCFASGKGEQLTKVEFNLAGNYIVIAKPAAHISTPYAYSKVTPMVPSRSLKDIVLSDRSTWANELINDFENSVFSEFNEVKSIKAKMYENGAWYASMSGSGSAVFGLFKNEPCGVNFEHCTVWSSFIK